MTTTKDFSISTAPERIGVVIDNRQDIAAFKLKADLETHHIEGYARESKTGAQFRVPLVNQVKGNLWQGGCVGGVNLQGFFKSIFSLYPWERYDPGAPLDIFVELRLYDSSGAMPDPRLLYSTARLINAAVAHGPTLVHCQAGLNRSGLLAGLSLIVGGMDPHDAIKLLRLSRGSDEVLCNGKFYSWLMEQKPGGFYSPSLSATAE